MRSRWLVAAGMVGCLAISACAGDPGVLTDSARRSAAEADVATPQTAPPESAPPATTDVPSTDPAVPTDPSAPPSTTPGTAAPPPTGDLLDAGDAKPPRAYDEFVRAALADIQAWWSERYPALYGRRFEPLQGGVYAAYPERTDPIPGCGRNRQTTTYEEIALYSAFYCMQGDFMVYDDGEDGILYSLAAEFGPTILGVVFAHEFGHAIQARAGDLEQGLPTITTEQQADCFAGAWVARAARGQAAGLSFTDADVRTGLIAMITVRDPVGIDQFSEGGHGSAFDRVGAFQVGFSEGLERCVQLIDDPLPLVPNQFRTREDQSTGGNAPFGYGAEELIGFLTTDLNEFWPAALATVDASGTPLNLVPVQAQDDFTCAEPAGDLALGAVYCPESGEVFFDENFGRELYDRFGDFSIGYMLGVAWSQAAQEALASPLGGEERALLSDCLTGAWVADILPAEDGTAPREVTVSPGDLDEAIQTALVVGDETSTDDVVGSGFEKIASFREGVLGGIPACTAKLGD